MYVYVVGTRYQVLVDENEVRSIKSLAYGVDYWRCGFTHNTVAG